MPHDSEKKERERRHLGHGSFKTEHHVKKNENPVHYTRATLTMSRHRSFSCMSQWESRQTGIVQSSYKINENPAQKVAMLHVQFS